MSSFGVFIGAAFMSLERGITALMILGIGMMLIAGFWVKDSALPDFIQWLKYTSVLRYAYFASSFHKFTHYFHFSFYFFIFFKKKQMCVRIDTPKISADKKFFFPNFFFF